MTHSDDDHRPGRGRSPEQERASTQRILNTFRSGRVGRHNGRPARTFHVAFRGVQAGAGAGTGGGRGASIDYIAREGDYADRQDLEHLAGDAGELEEAIAAVDAGCRIRNGRTAERVAIATVFELPADTSAEQRRRVAEEVVRTWRDRGHLAVAAIHATDQVQPHVHVLATARPVHRSPSGWEVDRSPARVPLRGKAAVRTARAEIAAIVNAACRPAVEFYPGRDADLDQPGIVGRKPKRRVPERRWHCEGQRERDPVHVAVSRAGHGQRQADQAATRAEREDRKRRRLAKAAEPLIQEVRAADRRRTQRVIEAGKSFRNDWLDEQRRADEARAQLAADRKAKTVEIEAAELRCLKAGERRFLRDRLAKHLPSAVAEEIAATADTDEACRRLAFHLAKAERGSAEAEELRSKLEATQAEVVRTRRDASVAGIAVGVAIGRGAPPPLDQAANMGLPPESLIRIAERYTGFVAAQAPHRPVQPPPAPPAPNSRPPSQEPSSGPPAGRRRPWRDRGMG